MRKIMNKKAKTNKRKRLSAEELAFRKEQRDQKKEIRDIMKRIGFMRLVGVDGTEFVYKERKSEIDDIFVCENVIILTEYTVGEPHLLKKSLIYNLINENVGDFVKFIIDNNVYNDFSNYYKAQIYPKYTINQLQLRILYCSKKSISQEHKDVVKGVSYFDYHIVKYFKSLTSVIKLSARYEFLEFLNIKEYDFGDNILSSTTGTTNCFSGHILPEEKSSFREGYKIISFYIDAESLLKRAYVLRQEGWRKKENVGYYQRMFDAKKIISMRKYLADQKRVFINNIIATVSENDIKLFADQAKRQEILIDDDGKFVNSNTHTNITPAFIDIQNKCNIIGIVDGQHRTYAYHEGDDIYESKISHLRKIQNLLVTGIIFPKNESREKRLKFEANLFLEINANQKKVEQRIQQEIQMQTMPFSNVAIGKCILNILNEHGPLVNLIEIYTFEKGKIRTSSIVSFGLKPLIKMDMFKNDTFYRIWDNDKKRNLLNPESQDYSLLNEYTKFCAYKISEVLSAFKACLDSTMWKPYNAKTSTGILTVTFINGVLNLIRLLIENNKLSDIETYRRQLYSINDFDLKQYKSSQYRRMGEDLYKKFFENN